MAGGAVGERPVLQVLALRLDPAWRRLSPAQRASEREEFVAAVAQTARSVTTLTYSSVGMRADTDLIFVRAASSFEDLEEAAAGMLRSGVGRSLQIAHSFTGLIRGSTYVKKPGAQEQALLSGERSRYLIVYPFTKTADWYRLSREARQGMMNEHIRVGHDFPQVRQLLAYSTGLDDQEFIVAYETDDLAAFQDLVVALRETEARRYTLRDQPILTAVFRPLEEALRLLG
ncbi:MAG: chlorite dismutase family protein [Armatimonadota bacterium]|nr:chlorite dismutase family protein [Armatimonadota bacterium]MDR7452340.1 chlorite dismutase family protein [Armatimonadota bacterium]MDR7466900.1 chlorite dismutase family protein [Armatimonadota bacterium]MDR7493558.1 chlorite dismutase family protein [Armatimonadota bacterium]MDR7498823.1 chlorite dismutase family protein [Armatimonadota bacterium]